MAGTIGGYTLAKLAERESRRRLIQLRETLAKPRLCPDQSVEPHELGEFPMTCYHCHLEADS